VKRLVVLLLAAVTGLIFLPATPAHALLPQESVTIHSGTNFNMCLDVGGFSFDDNAAILHFQCNGAPNQRFTPQFLGITTDRHRNRLEVYRLVSDWSNKCIQVRDEKTNSGAMVVQKTCSGHRSQWWLSLGALHFVPTDLVNGHTIDGLFDNARCMDVPNATTGFAVMQIWSCNGSAAQRFTFVP